jgi:hypothetical protein
VKSQVIEKNETGCGPATVNLFSASPVIFARRNARKKTKILHIARTPAVACAVLKSVCSTPAAHRFRVYAAAHDAGNSERERLKKAACEREEPSYALCGCCAAVQSISYSLNMQSTIMECACLMITIAQN